MTIKENKKYIQSETIVIKRSQINFASYNPKNHSKRQVEEQKSNIKRVAFLGGIIWNKKTKNLIDGHKRIQSLDLIHNYTEETKEKNDYEVKVESIELDEKTEKEQNIFSTKSATEFDDEKLKSLVTEIDYKNAGLDEYDLHYLGIDIPEIESPYIEEIQEIQEINQEQKNIENQLKKEQIKNIKSEIKQNAIEKTKDIISYVTLSFKNHQNKANFLNRFAFDEDITILDGEIFSEMIERIC